MFNLWKIVLKGYPLKSHLQALLIGFVISTFIIFPFIAGLINALLIYISFIYPILIVMNLFVSFWMFLAVYFYLASLKDSKETVPFEFKKTVLIMGTVEAAIWFFIGLVLIFTITPNIL